MNGRPALGIRYKRKGKMVKKRVPFKTALLLAALYVGASGQINATPSVISVSPTSGAGSAQTFSFVYSDPGGATNLTRGLFLISSALNAAGACYAEYNRLTGNVGLVNDAGNAWTYVPLSSSMFVQNNQCQILSGSVSYSGVNMTVNLQISFKPGFAGAKTTWMLAEDIYGVFNAGSWQAKGGWTVSGSNVAPTVTSVTPSAGSGTVQSFTFTYADADGVLDLKRGLFLINSTLNAAGACYADYNRVTNTIALLNDSATAWSSAPMSGSIGLQNNQCQIISGSVSLSGNSMSLTVQISFKPTFSGAKTIWLLAEDLAGAQNNGSAWQALGTWTTTTANAAPTVVSVSPNAGSGANQSFTFNFADPNGYGDLRRGLFIISSALNAAGACFGEYNRTTNNIGLVNDAGTGWSYAPLGAGMFVGNSQCQITGGSVSYSGNSMILTVQVTFIGGFAGAKTIWMLSEDVAGVQSNNASWQALGSWTVPTSGVPKPAFRPAGISYWVLNDNVEKQYDYGTEYGDLATSCSVSGTGVSTRIVSKSYSSIRLAFTASSSAPATTRSLSCSWSGGQAIGPPLDVYDATPRIDSMNPSVFERSDFEVPVTFIGAGFGTTPPTLQFSPPIGSWRIAPGNTPNQFTAYVIAPNAGSYDVTVLSNGTSGSGFQAGGGASQRGSNQARMNVVQGAAVLNVTVNGTSVSQGQTIFLPWQNPTVSITASLGGNVSGNVVWRLRADYKDGRDQKSCWPLSACAPDGRAWPWFAEYGPLPTTSVGQSWTYSTSTGGTISIDYSLNGSAMQVGIQFNIRGIAPPMTEVKQYAGSEPWFLTRLIAQESGYVMFINGGVPIWGPPAGYGIMQTDPPDSLANLFDWHSNVDEGKSRVYAILPGAINFWERQLRDWATWNESHDPVPLPDDQVEGLITFTATGNTTPGFVSFQDAIWLKRYNGATKDYISFINAPNSSNIPVGTWTINNTNSLGKNYVRLVCSQQP